MVRPKKDPKDKRTKKLMHYMTEQEEEQLITASKFKEESKNEFLHKAVQARILRMKNPPLELIQARMENIMQSEEELANGFICDKGHLFWLQHPDLPPISCPYCESKNLQRTWKGLISRM